MENPASGIITPRMTVQEARFPFRQPVHGGKWHSRQHLRQLFLRLHPDETLFLFAVLK